MNASSTFLNKPNVTVAGGDVRGSRAADNFLLWIRRYSAMPMAAQEQPMVEPHLKPVGTGPSSGRPPKGPGGPTNSDLNERLRMLEIQVARMDERVVGIREQMDKNMATKDDLENVISKMKVWILGGILSAIAVATLILGTVAKVLFS